MHLGDLEYRIALGLVLFNPLEEIVQPLLFEPENFCQKREVDFPDSLVVFENVLVWLEV
jgi:hypothetical protein